MREGSRRFYEWLLFFILLPWQVIVLGAFFLAVVASVIFFHLARLEHAVCPRVAGDPQNEGAKILDKYADERAEPHHGKGVASADVAAVSKKNLPRWQMKR